jgi:sulfite reductase (ferredoxin)
VGFRAPADDVPEALERLFTAFVANKQQGESIRSWTSRLGDAGVKTVLGGARPS